MHELTKTIHELEIDDKVGWVINQKLLTFGTVREVNEESVRIDYLGSGGVSLPKYPFQSIDAVNKFYLIPSYCWPAAPPKEHKALSICPICQGRGIVAGYFYDILGMSSTTAPLTTECRSCQGKGYI